MEKGVKSSDEGVLFRMGDGRNANSGYVGRNRKNNKNNDNGTAVNHTATSHNNKVPEHTVDTDSSVIDGKDTANSAIDKENNVNSQSMQ